MLLYCLKCKTPGRYYIGTTADWRWGDRLLEHKSGLGALWTRIHGFGKVMWIRTVRDKDAKRLEDEACAIMCARHGINSCRGGLFNIRSDVPVHEMPRWIVRPYFERRVEILAASQREI